MKLWFVLFLIVSIGIIVYSNSLGNDFIWDDIGFVITNDFIKSINHFPLYFTSRHALAKGDLAAENYRPFLPLSYAVDYHFWGLNPMGYHLTNLFFHISNAILLFFLALLLTKNRFVALITALLFLTHPVQTESVVWISGRADVLFLFFFLISVILYIRYAAQGGLFFYFLSLLFFVFGLFSKEMAASLPLLLMLYDLVYRKKDKIIPRAIRYFPYFLLLELYVSARYAVIGKLAQSGWWAGGPYVTFLTMLKGIVFYIRLLLYPVGLCADYLEFPVSTSIKDFAVLFSILTIAGLLAGGIFLAKRLRHISFSIMLFFVTLLPVMNIIPIRILIAERFLYLPSIGYTFALAVLFRFLAIKLRRRACLKRVFFIFPCILIFAYSYLTMERNVVWSDEILFNKDLILRYPNNARAHNNLAVAYADKGEDMEKAYEEARKAVELVPDYVYPKMIIAGYYVRKERYEEALKELEFIRQIEPGLVDVYKCFAAIYLIQKKYGDARRQYEKIFAWDPENLDAKFGIAAIYEAKGEKDLAIQEYEKMLSTPPPFHYRSYYAAAYLKLGDLYANSKNRDMAYKAWRKVYGEFKEEVWFAEISRFLTEQISLDNLLSKVEAWQADFKSIAFYYIAVKKELEGDIEGAITYYEKCKTGAVQKVDHFTAIAEKRLENLKKETSAHEQ